MQMLLQMNQMGITSRHLSDVLQRKTRANLREVLIEHDRHDGTPRVLNLIPLGAGFAFLISGYVIATLVLFLELLYESKKQSKSIGQLLSDIVNRRRSRVVLKSSDVLFKRVLLVKQ